MRIGGWILFVLGAAVCLLSFVILFRGDGFPLRILVYGIIFMVAGLRLKTYGTGITQPSASAAAANATAAPSPTSELPLTAGAANAIRASMKKSLRDSFLMFAFTAGLPLLIMAVALYFNQDVLSSPNRRYLVIPVAICGGAGLLFGGIVFLTSWLPLRRDLRETTYWVTAGPIQIVALTNSSLLRLADRAFLVRKDAAKQLAGLDWARVHHTKHAHLILGAWRQSGTSVILADEYEPDPASLISQP
jgi:hypothetical protein